MNTTSSLRMQATGRLGTALLLTAAATSRYGIGQAAVHIKPPTHAGVSASLTKPRGPSYQTTPRKGNSYFAPETSLHHQGSQHAPLARLGPSSGKQVASPFKLKGNEARAVAASLKRSGIAHPPDAHPGQSIAAKPASMAHTSDIALLAASARRGQATTSLSTHTAQPAQVANLDSPAAGSLANPGASELAAGAFNLSGTTESEHQMHLTVGHLMFLNTKSRVRRIYIANPAVLDSYTVTPNQIVITAKTPGLSSVVVWDQTDQSQVYMVSSDINVDELRASVKQAMPNESVQVEGREGKVVLSGTVGTDALSDAAGKLALLFSKDVANSLVVNSAKIRQVRLKVRIVEVDRSKLQQFGINIFNPGGGSTMGGGTTGQFPTTATLTPGSNGTPATLAISDPLNFLFYSFKYNIGVTIKDLENKQILQILAEPTITTLSGQKASFLAGGEFPFPVVQGSAGGTATVTVQFRPYGVKVDFTPQVNIDGSIALKVAPEVSALDFANSVTISGYTIPALSTKRADTQVVLQSGQSFAISGLLDRRTTDAFSHTPGIASVPILGQLFRSKNINLSTTELIVIVTPTIVDPLSEVLEAAEPVAEQHNHKDNPAPGLLNPASPTLGQPAPIVPMMKPEMFDSSLPITDKNKRR